MINPPAPYPYHKCCICQEPILNKFANPWIDGNYYHSHCKNDLGPNKPIITPGAKHDQGKPRYDLIPSKSLREIAEVLTFGAEKYAPDNWKTVSEPKARYYSALLRHLGAWLDGEINDTESGKPHLAHALCYLVFLNES